MSNIGNNPNPIGVTPDLSQHSMQVKEEITGGGTQTTLPENTQEGNLQTQFKPRKKAEDRKAVHIEHQQKPERRRSLPTITSKPLPNGHKSTKRLSLGDTPNDKSGVLQKEVSTIGNDKESGVNLFDQKVERVKKQSGDIEMDELNSNNQINVQETKTIKPPVWQKIGEGLKFAGKAIGVVALGALAIALLPLTIAGGLMMYFSAKKLDEKYRSGGASPAETPPDSLVGMQKQLKTEKNEEDRKRLHKAIADMEKEALPWNIMACVGTVLAAPVLGAVAIACL